MSKRGNNEKNPETVKKRKIDSRVRLTHFHSNHIINTFLTFRRHIACISRFNLYIHNLKTEYEKNNYFRIRTKGEYDLFLPSPQDPNWEWLLRAVYESINNENILMEDKDPFILNITSVYEDHAKRIINKDDLSIQTWFENAKRDLSTVPQRTLHKNLTPTTRSIQTLIFIPRHIKQIKKEP